MRDVEKTGNRKCWRVAFEDGTVAYRRLTRIEAMDHERGSLDPGCVRMWACRDGYKLVPCDGAAHSNAHIDNCMRCAPRWGWLMVPEAQATADAR